MNDSNNLSVGTRFMLALGVFMRALLRLILILFAATILGGLVYFGLVYIYQNGILPAQENTNRISILETRQVANQDQVNQRLHSFQQQLSALADQRIMDSEALAELHADQALLQAALDEQDNHWMRLDTLSQELQSLSLETEKALGLAQENQTRLDNGDPRLAQLQRETTVLRVAALLNRSLLSILQNNFGQARQEIELARLLLTAMEKSGTPEQQATQAAWLGRLDSALRNLPEFPVLARDDLETAWKMIILEGLPENARLESRTIFSATPPASTPAPTVIIQPSPTP